MIQFKTGLQQSIKKGDTNDRYLHPIKGRTTVICISVLIAFYVYHCLYWYGRTIDDAYITFRYARNFCKGLGLVYNPGERIEGYTNFSWVLLIALGMKLGFEPLLVAKFFGLLSGIGAIISGFWIFNKFSSRPYSPASLLVPVLLTTNSFFCFWSITGMETVFFSFLLILSIALYLKEGWKAHPLSAYVLSLLCLSRPDGFGYLAIFLAIDVFMRIKHRKTPDKYCIQFYGIIFLIISCYLGFKMLYYGTLLPNTFYVKVVLPFKVDIYKYRYLFGHYIGRNVAPAVMLIISLVVSMRFVERRIWLLILIVFSNWFYIIYVQTDFMENYRHHMYSLPVVFTIMSLGTDELIERFYKQKRLYGNIAAIIFVLMLVSHIGTNIRADSDKYYKKHVKKNVDKRAGWLKRIPKRIKMRVSKNNLTKQAIFLIENTNEEMVVGMRDIGFPGFISNVRVYDIAMLVNKKAQGWYKAKKTHKKKILVNCAFGEIRKELERYDPDFFFYPTSDFKLMKRAGKIMHEMYIDYFNTHMELLKRKELEYYGLKSYQYYRKKGSTWCPSTEELIRKYEKIVSENPSYLVFKKRLRKLKKRLKKEKLAK